MASLFKKYHPKKEKTASKINIEISRDTIQFGTQLAAAYGAGLLAITFVSWLIPNRMNFLQKICVMIGGCVIVESVCDKTFDLAEEVIDNYVDAFKKV